MGDSKRRVVRIGCMVEASLHSSILLLAKMEGR